MKQPSVYIMASRRNGTMYIGVTSDLLKRVYGHRTDLVEGLTRKYGIDSQVWYELHGTMVSAIDREKAIKEWPRKWKLQMIEKANPRWRDLYPDIIDH